jgi:PmbA protein
MIENGELTYPVKNLRFTQSYLQALANVESIGKETHMLVGEFGGFGVRIPALKIKSFNFTGSTA